MRPPGMRSPTSLTAQDFYRADHRIIFEAAAAVSEQGKPIDVVTLSEHLERHGQLDDAGGLAYLGTLARDTPSAANIRAYAEIVRERSLAAAADRGRHRHRDLRLQHGRAQRARAGRRCRAARVRDRGSRRARARRRWYRVAQHPAERRRPHRPALPLTRTRSRGVATRLRPARPDDRRPAEAAT